MKIDFNANSVDNFVGQSPVAKPDASTSRTADATPAEKPEVSGDSGRISFLKAELNRTPDVRQERVAALQAKIRQGTYNVSDEQIANAIIAGLGK